MVWASEPSGLCLFSIKHHGHRRIGKEIYWDEELGRIFEESKKVIIEKIKDGVCSFEKDGVTCLSTDWSKTGIGFTLTQKYCECPRDPKTNAWSPVCGKGHWRIILAGSRFTKPAESRYAPVEGEALAVVYGLNQCRNFILGSPNLVVAVDHKPLTRILNDRSLECIENPRLLRMKEKTLMYDYQIVHVDGKSNTAPDAASRYPSRVASLASEDIVDEEYTRAYAVMQSENIPGSMTWQEVDTESSLDEECCKLREAVQSDFPESRSALPESLQKYFKMRENLYVIDNVVFKGKKMLIPKSLRRRVLNGLHAAHQGVSSMRAYARERLFWPGLGGEIKQIRDHCRQCIEIAPSQAAEPMVMTPAPDIPFQQVVCDFYHSVGNTYLIYADRYTGWTEVAKTKSTAFKNIEKSFLTWFKTFGVPEEISADGGPPFKPGGKFSNEMEQYWRRCRGVAE